MKHHPRHLRKSSVDSKTSRQPPTVYPYRTISRGLLNRVAVSAKRLHLLQVMLRRMVLLQYHSRPESLFPSQGAPDPRPTVPQNGHEDVPRRTQTPI